MKLLIYPLLNPTSFFVNAYLKDINSCIIVENKCLYNQLAASNSYCIEKNTLRIYKTNIQNNILKKRVQLNETYDLKLDYEDINKKKDKISNYISNYHRKKDSYKNNYKKKKDKILMKHIIKNYETIVYSKKLINNTDVSESHFMNNTDVLESHFMNNTKNYYKNIVQRYEKSNNIKNINNNKNEKNNKNANSNDNDYNKIEHIDCEHMPIKVSLIGRDAGLINYSSELCKIDYDNFSDKGVYLFDRNNRLVTSTSVSIKSMYICHDINGINCYQPKVDGFYLNALQKAEVIELSGLQKENTIITNIQPEDGYSYINSELYPKSTYKFNRDIIVCNYDINEEKVLCNIIDGSEETYYIQKEINNNSLIECLEGNCNINTNNVLDGFYINSASSSMNNTLIYCKNSNCILKAAENEKYYLGIQHSSNVVIECKNNNCFYNKNINPGYYLNAGMEIEDNEKPIIYCDSFHKCELKTVSYNRYGHFISAANAGYLITCKNNTYCEEENSLANTGYYINNGQNEVSSDPNLIFCYDSKNKNMNRICEEINIKDTDEKGHFISGIPGHLINYMELEKDKYILIHSHPETGFYLNNGDSKNNTQSLIYCEGALNSTLALTCQSINSSNGYYLMQSSRISIESDFYTQLIFCEDLLCRSSDPVKGYFKYALNNEIIISCDGYQCRYEIPEECQTTIVPSIYSPGNCCHYQSEIYLITDHFNITSIEDTSLMNFKNHSIPFQANNTIKYAYFEIEYSEFPGISINPGSLYKISKYSFTYFPYNNYFIMDENNEQFLTLNTTITKYDLNKLRLFNCNSDLEICIPELRCEISKYIYYEPLNIGLQCYNSSLEVIKSEGNYLDENNNVLRCDKNGKSKLLTASHITDNISNGLDTDVESCFIINSGFNSTYPLIKCTKTSCSLYEPNKGYYYDCEANKIIEYINTEKYYYVNNTMEFPVHFINSGAESLNDQLISCTKNKCISIMPNEGYYLTNKNNKLIHCDNTSLCKEIEPKTGYYDDANSLVNNTSHIIHCYNNSTKEMNCYKEKANEGFYLSVESTTLINCVNDDKKCKTITRKPGIYISAILRNSNYDRRSSDDLSVTLNQKDHNLIKCTINECQQLTEEELMEIPVCEYFNNKCFISLRYSSFKMQTQLITTGGYCTNYYHSKIYFAIKSIEVEPLQDNLDYNELFSNISENCIEASHQYRSYYYTIDNTIYTVDDNQISSIIDNGYYFINKSNNTLFQSNDIKLYNDDNIELYHCNGDYCLLIDKISKILYFVDVNKRIFKFDQSHHKYFFAYEKDIICSHNYGSCTTLANVEDEEFCIETNGQLVFLQDKISVNSVGPCTMKESSSSESIIYYKNLYRLTTYSAELIEDKGYYLINNSTRVSAELKDFKDAPHQIILYGCNGDYCKEYIPKDGVYYYDYLMKYLFKYENNIWTMATKSGYGNISLYPGLTYIYKFDINNNIATISSNKLNYGYYYTIDNKMFECPKNKKECFEKDSTGYVMTSTGEIYYCEYNNKLTTHKVYENTSLNSSNIGYRNILSSCIKKKCKIGEYYYMNNNYYQCKKDSIFTLMKKEQCIDDLDVESIQENYEDIAKTEGFGKYIIHFPIKDKDSYPDSIKYLNYLIQNNNNSTAEDIHLSSDYLSSISGVFRNCRYDLETTTMVFDLICLNNYVSLAKNLAKINEEILNKKDTGIDKGNMIKYDLSGILSFLKKRKNDDNNNDNNENKNKKNSNVLEEFEISYKKDNDAFICSTQHYGYIECQKDKNNPDKCLPSQAKLKYILSMKVIYLIVIMYYLITLVL
ncbi:hypothetical protein BCR32DRAFT_268047 [Anaeromyces robustus]|uniref:Scaffoldin n=1 Tax=Anaeromyces robustus TaxID=1754192 RepID=A0A1Y1X8Z7_9FUNG|nr:hypothetical protein BCR32DRAFT_268047 [Anaeromyces robustus]|eukprot:ORX81824.1 hypothetical protein BCR32DRAFT_268047 [Anaeromyces robustus]